MQPHCCRTFLHSLLRGFLLLLFLTLLLRYTLTQFNNDESLLDAVRKSPLTKKYYHEERYHAKMMQDKTKDVAFEGWYYKLVGPYSDDVVVCIVGLLTNHVNASSSEAFITIAHNTRVNYYRFPPSAFIVNTTQTEGFSVTLGDSHFTEKSITLSVMPDENDDAVDVTMGEIKFDAGSSWPQKLFSPSTMGFLTFLPSFLSFQCSHQVVSLHHRLHGYILIGDTLTDLEQGTGYTEKDWGDDFPQTWLWLQSNHFAMLKPPKRGKGKNEVEGEVWAESEENVEEVGEEDAPGAGESSGAISALYADHLLNHESPVSLFLTVARVPLPLPDWLFSLFGSSENDHFYPGFIVGFLYQSTVYTFTSYNADSLTTFKETIGSKKEMGKEVVHLTFVDSSRSTVLQVEIHKPVSINGDSALLKRKKDTECLKKSIAQRNRERERLGGKLNPIEEEMLKQKMEMDRDESITEQERAALQAGIDAERANTPEAKLASLYNQPLPTPAPVIASMYGPRDGEMQKYVKESLIGGRVEVKLSKIVTSGEYTRMNVKERRGSSSSSSSNDDSLWSPLILNSAEVYYSSQIYRGIGKPTAMELMGDIEWMMEETQRREREWNEGWIEWIGKRKNLSIVIAVVMIVLLLSALLSGCMSCLCGGFCRPRQPKTKLKEQ